MILTPLTGGYKMIDVIQEDGKWWLVDPKCDLPLGPYDTQVEAKQAKTGLNRFYREVRDERGQN